MKANPPARTTPRSIPIPVHGHVGLPPIERRAARGATPAAPNVAYSIRAFVDDHRNLVSALASFSPNDPAIVEQLDGRMVVVRSDLLSRVAVGRQREVFGASHGPLHEKDYRERFRLVLEFLATWERDLRESGLALGQPFLAVREELVGYLLRYELSPSDRAIPRRAWLRFLDEWSHRWW
jgi:hypothetical protein